MRMEAKKDYFYVNGDVKRRFTYLGKKTAYPLAPVDCILWTDTNQEKQTCIGMLKSNGAKIEQAVTV